jgi:hypothetical protein
MPDTPLTTGSPITDARLQRGLEYWRSKAEAAGRAMPRRADIDPGEIPKLLPDIMLIDVLPEGRYRYRLIGTANAEAHGINAKGRYLDEVLPGPEYRAHVLGLYNECVEARRPLYSESMFISTGQRIAERTTKVLFLPLSEDGERVNIVMVLQVFFYTDQSTRNRHFIDARPYREVVHTLL